MLTSIDVLYCCAVFVCTAHVQAACAACAACAIGSACAVCAVHFVQ